MHPTRWSSLLVRSGTGGHLPPDRGASGRASSLAPGRPDDGGRRRRPTGRHVLVAIATATATLLLVLVVRDRVGGQDAAVRVRRSDGLTAPVDSTPVDSTPIDSTPVDSTPVDSTPIDQIPVTTAPADEPVPTVVPPVGTDGGPDPNDPDLALVDPNVFVDLLPDLARMPAPEWLRTGTRLSYYSAVASVPGSYHEYVEDENGGWIDPDSGRRYDQIDIPGTGGHGYNQVTVTALTRSVAVLSVRSYGLTDLALDSPVATLKWGGTVGMPGAGSDWWLHPAVLAGVDEVVTDDLKVLRMPYTIDGREFDSLWVQSLGDTSNFTWVYDLDTGVLLHTASSTVGPPIAGPVAAGEGRDGSTFLTQSTLVAVRDTDLPWAGQSPPDWLADVALVQYRGSITVGDPAAPAAVLDARLDVETLSTGSRWGRYRYSRTMSTDVTPSVTEALERIDGPAQVGALWVPPAGLQDLVADQVLDVDPLTSTEVRVTEVAPDGTVTIAEIGPREESTAVYDPESGLLVAITTVDRHLGTTSAFEFVGWS